MNRASTMESRIASLDILRGVAVMGILAMNIVAFAMPPGAYFNPRAYGDRSGVDLAVWTFNFIFVDGKMRGLFSLLFGASMLLVVEHSAAKGENPWAIHFRRMAWLLLFGLAHLYLIWWGDILSHYALIGLIAYLFRDKPVVSLLKWAGGFIFAELVLTSALSGGLMLLSGQAAAPDAAPEAIRQWQEMKVGFGPLPAAKLAEHLALFDGGYRGILVDRLAQQWATPITAVAIFGLETLGYMLIGMAGLKSGFLAGAWDAARYRRWMLGCYAIGMPAYGLLAYVDFASGFDIPTVATIALAAATPFRPIMIVGHAALILLLTRHGGWLVERIGAAGRAAFTNYFGTSLVMTTLFYGYGFGLYGEMSRAQLYGVVIAMWALMLLWSKPWLDRYRYGPFEWLWRTLARGAIQPMLKAPAST